MKNIYTGGGWARNLMRFMNAEDNVYFNIGATAVVKKYLDICISERHGMMRP